VDLSTERLARAPEYLAGIVDIELVHGELVSFAPRGRFHVVYAFEVFQYLSYAEQLQVLERWLPHLEPGGSLVVLDKDRYSRHALICELQKVLGPLDFVLGRLRKFPPHYRALFRTIHYPDFRRLAAHFRGRTRLEVRVARHAEFSSLTLRRG
jgi:SAM-dependent methyltransferase